MTVNAELRVTEWFERELSRLETRFNNMWRDFSLDEKNKQAALNASYAGRLEVEVKESGIEKAARPRKEG